MGARRGGRAAAAVAACLAGLASAPGAAQAAEPGGTCELARVVDRARTPSFQCMACHDGSAGTGSVFAMKRGPELGMSHPVEVDYEAVSGRDPAHYVPSSRLPPLVPLVDGKVACTSCHDGASRFDKHVVDPARLCYACHRL